MLEDIALRSSAVRDGRHDQLVDLAREHLVEPRALRPLFEAQVARLRDPADHLHQRLPVGLDHVRAERATARTHDCDRATRRMRIQTDVPVHGIPPVTERGAPSPRSLPSPPGGATRRLGLSRLHRRATRPRAAPLPSPPIGPTGPDLGLAAEGLDSNRMLLRVRDGKSGGRFIHVVFTLPAELRFSTGAPLPRSP
jgi:hypothetical protein